MKHYKQIFEASADDLWKYYDGKIERKDYDAIIKADPTSKYKNDEIKFVGNYSKWLLKLFISKKLKLEDLYKATEYLTIFDKHKSKVPVNRRDMNKFNSITDVYEVLVDNDLLTAKTHGDKRKEIEEGAFEITLIYEDDEWIVVIPKTEEASCFWGKGTQWCTASKSNNYFSHYNQDGPLYILTNKKNDNKYQFHIESGQFMDSNDRQIDLKNFMDKNGKLKSVFRKKFAAYAGLTENYKNVKVIGDNVFIKEKNFEELLTSRINSLQGNEPPINALNVFFDMNYNTNVVSSFNKMLADNENKMHEIASYFGFKDKTNIELKEILTAYNKLDLGLLDQLGITFDENEKNIEKFYKTIRKLAVEIIYHTCKFYLESIFKVMGWIKNSDGSYEKEVNLYDYATMRPDDDVDILFGDIDLRGVLTVREVDLYTKQYEFITKFINNYDYKNVKVESKKYDKYKRYFESIEKSNLYLITYYGDGKREATPIKFIKGSLYWPSGDKVTPPKTVLKKDMQSIYYIKKEWAFYTWKGGRNFKLSDYATEDDLKKLGIVE